MRESRLLSPDEFAIALEQVVAGTAPLYYRDPAQFFSRTSFTRALKNHAGMVLRRLADGIRPFNAITFSLEEGEVEEAHERVSRATDDEPQEPEAPDGHPCR